jgi:hypothetical protein
MIRLLVTLLITAATPAQTGVPSSQPASGNSSDGVLKPPYSAQRRFTSIENLPDGTTRRSEAGGSEARDSQGRTYSAGERHWTYLDNGRSVEKSEMLYRIHDPVANTETRWDSTSKEAKVIHWPKSEPGVATLNSFSAFLAADTVTEKLGGRTIEGVLAEGTRTSYTIAGTRDHNGKPLRVVHDSWYCPELKIVVLETNDDPRSGTTRNELVGIVRGEPSVTKYRPPADYVIHEVRVPVQ